MQFPDLSDLKLDETTVTYAVGAAGALWLGSKVLRAGLHALSPSKFPGEPNTALLASPLVTDFKANNLDNVREYDYVICGGGTAGCVLAARLTEDPKVSVLVIEAGHSDLKQLLSRVPAGFGQLFESAADWNLLTEPQKHANGRRLFWPRGKMLGGCSAINAMMYQRASPDDYNEWAEKYGCKGWAYDDCEKYFKRAECFTPNSRFPIDSEEEHGKDGPWQTGYAHVHQSSIDFVEAMDKVGIKKIKDINTRKGPLGSAIVQTFIDKKGQRSSTAVAYINPEVAARPNLKIATGQNVTRILFDTTGATPKAVGVEMASRALSPIRYRVKARKEVLLCAGAVHSPQILMCSGIGPAAHLKEMKIPLVKDHPGVGENLQDHQMCDIVAETDANQSIQFITDKLKGLPALVEWLIRGTGPMTCNVGETYAFLQIKDWGGEKLRDQCSGPKGPDVELLSGPVCYINHGRTLPKHSHGSISLLAIGLRPESRGTIRLASDSVFDQPLIDPNAFASDNDLETMALGAELVYKVFQTEPIKSYVKGWDLAPKGDPAKASHQDWRQFVLDTFETLYHPVGTCKMGSAHDNMAVLDTDLKVRGVDNLRVIDASVFPRILGTHTCAPVVMIAEKASDMIRGKA